MTRDGSAGALTCRIGYGTLAVGVSRAHGIHLTSAELALEGGAVSRVQIERVIAASRQRGSDD